MLYYSARHIIAKFRAPHIVTRMLEGGAKMFVSRLFRLPYTEVFLVKIEGKIATSFYRETWVPHGAD